MPPTKLAHLVFRTNQLERMVQWYCDVLEARRTFSDSNIACITYDDEHHRIAFVGHERWGERPEGRCVGFHHCAFTYSGLGDLLETYQRLKARGIVPWRPILHGPTLSMYYRDPDGNDVELQVDSYAKMEDAVAFMQSEAFARDALGPEFDPEEMIAKLKAGVPAERLVLRPDAVENGS